ncbi:Transcription factor bHLH128 [Linum perenne]
MYPPPPPPPAASTSSSSSPQKSGLQSGGLARYCSAPGSFLTRAVDSVIGSVDDRHFSPAVNRYFSSGGESDFSSSQLTSESTCRVNSSSGDQLKIRSGELNAIARGASSVAAAAAGTSSSSLSSLLRQKSSPAGFLTNLVSESGFTITRGNSGNYDSNNNGGGGYPVQGLKSQLSFTGQESLSHISEASESDAVEAGISENGRHNNNSYAPPSGFVMDTWDHNNNNSNSITFSSPGQQANNKRYRSVDGDFYTCYNGLETQFSMPQTTLEMAAVDKMLQIPEDSVPCKVRAKRGCATHPRSIAERERRTRISGRLKKLQDLVPNMDKQTSYSDMLDLAVQHIKGLQHELEVRVSICFTIIL